MRVRRNAAASGSPTTAAAGSGPKAFVTSTANVEDAPGVVGMLAEDAVTRAPSAVALTETCSGGAGPVSAGSNARMLSLETLISHAPGTGRTSVHGPIAS